MREVSREVFGTLLKDRGGACWSDTGAQRPTGLATHARICVPAVRSSQYGSDGDSSERAPKEAERK